ncbi:hypothetical protein D6D20_08358 [Aureobasidium pullulans]|uniref:Uncharacterized protein n=1 Tax=Aureobasidium pullulans TaxID=5580 RepID=A0A4S8Z002_AURPU|nr:hypothetical protein D6D20_08358 [Aureobasidium pullulans]
MVEVPFQTKTRAMRKQEEAPRRSSRLTSSPASSPSKSKKAAVKNVGRPVAMIDSPVNNPFDLSKKAQSLRKAETPKNENTPSVFERLTTPSNKSKGAKESKVLRPYNEIVTTKPELPPRSANGKFKKFATSRTSSAGGGIKPYSKVPGSKGHNRPDTPALLLDGTIKPKPSVPLFDDTKERDVSDTPASVRSINHASRVLGSNVTSKPPVPPFYDSKELVMNDAPASVGSTERIPHVASFSGTAKPPVPLFNDTGKLDVSVVPASVVSASVGSTSVVPASVIPASVGRIKLIPRIPRSNGTTRPFVPLFNEPVAPKPAAPIVNKITPKPAPKPTFVPMPVFPKVPNLIRPLNWSDVPAHRIPTASVRNTKPGNLAFTFTGPSEEEKAELRAEKLQRENERKARKVEHDEDYENLLEAAKNSNIGTRSSNMDIRGQDLIYGSNCIYGTCKQSFAECKCDDPMLG